jgi:hypothetical protein
MCSQSVKELIKPPLRKASAKVATFQITAKCFENFFKKMKKKRKNRDGKERKAEKKAKKKKKREQGEEKAQGRERGGFRQKGRRRNNDTKAIGHSNEARQYNKKRHEKGNGTEKRAKKTGLR